MLYTQQVLAALLGNASASEADGADGALRTCRAVAQQLLKQLEQMRKEKFESWQQSMRAKLDELAALQNTRLLTFDAKNLHVKTEFNEQLVTMLREVRACRHGIRDCHVPRNLILP